MDVDDIEYDLEKHDVWYIIAYFRYNETVARLVDINIKYKELWRGVLNEERLTKFLDMMSDNKYALLYKGDEVLGGAACIKLRTKHPIQDIIYKNLSKSSR